MPCLLVSAIINQMIDVRRHGGRLLKEECLVRSSRGSLRGLDRLPNGAKVSVGTGYAAVRVNARRRLPERKVNR